MIDRRNIEHLGYGLFLVRLDELRESSGKEILSFPDVFQKLCRNFSISKQLCKRILQRLYVHGYIEYVNSHGIRLMDFTKKMLIRLENLDSQING